MAHRSYRQYCGLVRAVEMIGERWALLIVRDLLVGPRRFTDLRGGLPGIPSNVLTARLKELELTGIVTRRAMPRPAAAVVYELTPYGRDAEEAVAALGRWGAKALGEPLPGEAVTADSLVMALRATFDARAARGRRLGFELRVGTLVLHARVDDGTLSAGEGPLPGADAVIETGLAIRAVMAREVSPSEALARGKVRVTGDPSLLAAFAELFPIGARP